MKKEGGEVKRRKKTEGRKETSENSVRK